MTNNEKQKTPRKKRGRPPLPPAKRRRNVVRVQLNDAEIHQLERLMQQAGANTRAAFCREAALGKSTANSPGRELGRELKKLRHQLDLARETGQMRHPLLEEIEGKLDQITGQFLGEDQP